MRIIAVASCLLLFSCIAYGQSCDCPAVTLCGTCQGGIKSLTLRFNGGTAKTITAADLQGTVFSQVVDPGATFSFTGSLPNDKFVGVKVDLTVDGSPDASIPSNCGTVFVGNVYGSFTIVSALSKNGGPLCCSAANQETTPPVITGCPSDITIELPPTQCEVAGGWTEPTSSDNCNIASFTSTNNPADLFGIGVTTVTYTATDSYNNSSTCSFTVTVVDKVKPAITNCPGNVTLEATSSCGAAVSWTEPTAIDNCSRTFTSDHVPGETFAIGETIVTYTATDPSGNISTCSFTVTVKDTTAPLITGCPADITVEATGCEAVVSWTTPNGSDNCTFTLTGSHLSGSIFALGTTNVLYTATDAAGLTSTCSFNVIVTTAAVPTVTGCPENITYHTFDESIEATWTPPQATAACGDLISNASHQPGTLFGVGNTTVVYGFDDATNNHSECRFNVTVIRDEPTFEVSKAVTPNGDGINDTWQVTDIEKFTDNTVLIVDRWGNRIYHTSGYDNINNAWNGSGVGGSKVPAGTYFYTIEIRVKETTVRNSGFIEVIY